MHALQTLHLTFVSLPEKHHAAKQPNKRLQLPADQRLTAGPIVRLQLPARQLTDLRDLAVRPKRHRQQYPHHRQHHRLQAGTVQPAQRQLSVETVRRKRCSSGSQIDAIDRRNERQQPSTARCGRITAQLIVGRLGGLQDAHQQQSHCCGRIDDDDGTGGNEQRQWRPSADVVRFVLRQQCEKCTGARSGRCR